MVLIEDLFVVHGGAYRLLYEKYSHAEKKKKCSYCSEKTFKTIIKVERIYDNFSENEINLSSPEGQRIAKEFSKMFLNICPDCANQKDERRG